MRTMVILPSNRAEVRILSYPFIPAYCLPIAIAFSLFRESTVGYEGEFTLTRFSSPSKSLQSIYRQMIFLELFPI